MATAKNLATIFYRMASKQVEFSPMPLDGYQEKHKKAKIAYPERKLKDLKKQTA